MLTPYSQAFKLVCYSNEQTLTATSFVDVDRDVPLVVDGVQVRFVVVGGGVVAYDGEDGDCTDSFKIVIRPIARLRVLLRRPFRTDLRSRLWPWDISRPIVLD